MMPLSAVAPTIADRVGTRTTLLVGTGLFGVGLAIMASMASVSGGYWSIVPGLLVLAAGMGLAMTPSTTSITGALPTEKQGVASVLNDTVRDLGGALGVAFATETLPAGLRERVESGISSALAVSSQLGDDAGSVVRAARTAFVSGWQTSVWVGVALAAVALLYVLFRGPKDDAIVSAPAEPDEMVTLDGTSQPVLVGAD
jgi:MFS family permease